MTHSKTSFEGVFGMTQMNNNPLDNHLYYNSHVRQPRRDYTNYTRENTQAFTHIQQYHNTGIIFLSKPCP